jgi:hypothetical protein
MSEKKLNLALLSETPPATDGPSRIDFGALAEGLKRLDDLQLSNALSFVRELCSDEPPPSPIAAAARTFAKYWGKYSSPTWQ